MSLQNGGIQVAYFHEETVGMLLPLKRMQLNRERPFIPTIYLPTAVLSSCPF